MDNKITVTGTPHVRSADSVQSVMLNVLIALAPATIMGIYFFGMPAIIVIALTVASSVLFEYLYQKFTKQEITINDLSAAVTGLLLAMNMPASSPWWMCIIGSAFAIIICKQLFGGLGQNFINPALGARAFLLASYPADMTSWTAPSWSDAVTTATPLSLLKSGDFVAQSQDYIDALIGNIGGCIGETSAIALIIGGLYLVYKHIISIRIPAVFIGTVFILTWILGRDGIMTGQPLYEIITGGIMLGAFFMATDYASSPVTPKGQIIMAVGCGLITTLIRVYGGYPEGVSYSILFMNLCVPLIDRYTRPRVFGVSGVKK